MRKLFVLFVIFLSLLVSNANAKFNAVRDTATVFSRSGDTVRIDFFMDKVVYEINPINTKLGVFQLISEIDSSLKTRIDWYVYILGEDIHMVNRKDACIVEYITGYDNTEDFNKLKYKYWSGIVKHLCCKYVQNGQILFVQAKDDLLSDGKFSEASFLGIKDLRREWDGTSWVGAFFECKKGLYAEKP